MMTVGIEIYRKLLHISLIWIVLVYYCFGFYITEKVLLSLLLFMICFEFSRLKSEGVGKFAAFLIEKMKLNQVIREKERNRLTGATQLLIAAYMTIYLLPEMFYLPAFSIAIISDSVAAFIGKKYGQTFVLNKTVEGSIGFLLSAAAISFFWWSAFGEDYRYLFLLLTAAATTAMAELCATKLVLDDNMLVFLVYSITIFVMSSAFSAVQVAPW
jgi:dolichol kinase